VSKPAILEVDGPVRVTAAFSSLLRLEGAQSATFASSLTA
jgi:hypothetical protein